MKKIILFLLILGTFFLSSKTSIFACAKGDTGPGCGCFSEGVTHPHNSEHFWCVGSSCKTCSTGTIFGGSGCNPPCDCSLTPSASGCACDASHPHGYILGCGSDCMQCSTGGWKNISPSCPSCGGSGGGSGGGTVADCTTCSGTSGSVACGDCDGITGNKCNCSGSSCTLPADSTCPKTIIYCSANKCPAAGSCTPICRTTSYTYPDGNCNNLPCAANCTGACFVSGTVCNHTPVYTGLTLQNSVATTVIAENNTSAGPNVNQICDSQFGATDLLNRRTVRYVVSFTDSDANVSLVQLRFNGGGVVRSHTSLNNVNGIATFDISDLTSSAALYNPEIKIDDPYETTGWNVSNRKLKVWSCNVPISGTGYDGSATDASCSDPSFLVGNEIGIGYTLTMNDVGPGAGTDKSMTVNSPDYTDGSNPLIWGRDYVFTLTHFEGGDPSIKINNVCSNVQFTVSTDPYSAAPSLIIDFTSVLHQDPWWQAKFGGAISNFEVNSRVPVTCPFPSTNADCNVSRGGLVSAPALANAKISFDSVQPWYYGDTSNDGTPNLSAKLANNNTSYSSFYSQYYVKNEVGVVLTGNKTIADIGATGIYFVDGNLTIDNRKTINSDQFLMIIVKGDINVATTVTRVDGILVANNIGASGDNDTSLTFNGSLYALNEINFSRGHIDKSINNITPAVIVKYNPRLIFNLPGGIAKALTSWQWGN